MVQYLMWRTLTGRHSTVHYSFLVVGHTKFAPDGSFGLFKHLFKRTKVGSIAEIEEVVNQSAVCNVAQVVCHVAQVVCHVAQVVCHVAQVVCHVAQVVCHVAQVVCHVAQVVCHVAQVVCHVAQVVCHVAQVVCHVAEVVCHVAQVVCQEDRSMIVPMYNWSTLLAPHFKKIVGIK